MHAIIITIEQSERKQALVVPVGSFVHYIHRHFVFNSVTLPLLLSLCFPHPFPALHAFRHPSIREYLGWRIFGRMMGAVEDLRAILRKYLGMLQVKKNTAAAAVAVQ